MQRTLAAAPIKAGLQKASARRGFLVWRAKKSRRMAGNESILEYMETRYRGDTVGGQGGSIAFHAAFVGKMRWPSHARFANEPAEAGPFPAVAD
ncbi:hypothetical protein [Cupriavidus sp. CuC1]|uniref:hypothetical protein n=1 Tax=Cupriavidus TaxID=106589 RepID=UPI00296A9064|nr:hypothetical protein [Cupriavidus sp. CV2]MDW3682612.1 hypothetical protein [Cupriavidus sp. CV2]